MGNITDNRIAKGTGAGMQNVAFAPGGAAVPRKQVIIATYDPAKTGVVDETPVLVLSPSDTGSIFGFGFMAEALHRANNLGAQGAETWIQPQSEVGTAAEGELDFTGSTGIIAGTLALYISNARVAVSTLDGMSVEELADAIVAKITSLPELLVTAVKVAVTFEVTITSKSKGPWGNDISLSLNNLSTDETPTGIVFATTPMASGATLPDITDALNGLGIDDAANEKFFTSLIHGYGQDTTTLNAIQNYVGATDTLSGLYSETVHRPFFSLVGDVVAGSTGLSDLITLSDARLTDRSTGIIPVPDSLSNPHEIAAQTIGHIERTANNIVAQGYGDIALIGVHTGSTGERWTDNGDDRDTAVKAGIGTTLVQAGVVVLQDLVTMSRPASTPVPSNAYREIVNIVKWQNILNSLIEEFTKTKYQGAIIVDDTTLVASSIRPKAFDAQAIKDALYGLIDFWESQAYIFQGQFSKQNLTVDIRVGADGFNNVIPLIASGVGKIFDNRVNADTSIAILL